MASRPPSLALTHPARISLTWGGVDSLTAYGTCVVIAAEEEGALGPCRIDAHLVDTRLGKTIEGVWKSG